LERVSRPPSFPPPALVAKVLELGPGSGPWSRSELAARWGESSANKFIAEAKDAGWVVAPVTNAFYVPPARDLMTVNWLTGIAKQEFVLARTLAAGGFRCWCLSSWARRVGIETDKPLFVTDLSTPPERTSTIQSKAPPPASIAERNRHVAERIRTLPFLGNVILVPFLPQSRWIGEEEIAVVGPGVTTTTQSPSWILGSPAKQEPSSPSTRPGDEARLSYPLAPAPDDPAWILALLAALGLARFNEVLPALTKKEALDEPPLRRLVRIPLGERIRNWGGLFSPPEPNANWRTAFQSGRSQYLLVPEWLWKESASLSNARRFQDLSREVKRQ